MSRSAAQHSSSIKITIANVSGKINELHNLKDDTSQMLKMV